MIIFSSGILTVYDPLQIISLECAKGQISELMPSDEISCSVKVVRSEGFELGKKQSLENSEYEEESITNKLFSSLLDNKFISRILQFTSRATYHIFGKVRF